jgi:hypothetical protein
MDLKRNKKLNQEQRERYMDMVTSCHSFMWMLAKLDIVDKTDGYRKDGSINAKAIGDTDNLIFRLLS